MINKGLEVCSFGGAVAQIQIIFLHCSFTMWLLLSQCVRSQFMQNCTLLAQNVLRIYV